jgi:hypothetical protein
LFISKILFLTAYKIRDIAERSIAGPGYSGGEMDPALVTFRGEARMREGAVPLEAREIML